LGQIDGFAVKFYVVDAAVEANVGHSCVRVVARVATEVNLFGHQTVPGGGRSPQVSFQLLVDLQIQTVVFIKQKIEKNEISNLDLANFPVSRHVHRVPAAVVVLALGLHFHGSIAQVELWQKIVL